MRGSISPPEPKSRVRGSANHTTRSSLPGPGRKDFTKIPLRICVKLCWFTFHVVCSPPGVGSCGWWVLAVLPCGPWLAQCHVQAHWHTRAVLSVCSTAPHGVGALRGVRFRGFGARAFQQLPRLPWEKRTQSLKGGREARSEAVQREQVD